MLNPWPRQFSRRGDQRRQNSQDEARLGRVTDRLVKYEPLWNSNLFRDLRGQHVDSNTLTGRDSGSGPPHKECDCISILWIKWSKTLTPVVVTSPLLLGCYENLSWCRRTTGILQFVCFLSPGNYRASQVVAASFDYLALEVEDHSRKRVHMFTTPVTGVYGPRNTTHCGLDRRYSFRSRKKVI